MDGERFDAITKTFAGTSHRRRLLSRVAAGIGVLGASALTRQPAAAARPGGLCCQYVCQFEHGTRPVVHLCVPDPKGKGPQARCPGSHANCSFDTADAIASCSECPNP
jgi:hypothetical protein